MRLKGIEIQGFKSFPDKTKLTFNKNITAVIGPNGSGKSNISDAIRWVLGEQSNKQLRGKSMEDVIFGGTQKRKSQGFAEVSLVLDNSDRRLDFDNDNITVTRRYFRSGESEYKINGAGVRLKDVHSLFMDTGLGRDGYSMIGQGKIDEIVGSKSNERRDIFEEAAGISKYRYRRAEAERKLSAAEENLLRLKDIFTELEDRVGPLKEQSQKAQKFLEFSEEKKQLEIGLWLHTLDKSNDRLREQENKITVVSSQYESIEKELEGLISSSEASLSEINKITAQIDAVRRAAASADEESAEVKSEIAVINNNILHYNENIDRLKSEIAAANSDDESLQKQSEEKAADIEETKKIISAKNNELNVLLEKLSGLTDDSGDYSEQIEEKNKKLNDLSQKISDCKVEIVAAQTSMDEISASLVDYQPTSVSLQKETENLQSEIALCDKDLQDCETTITECGNIVGGHEIKLNTRLQKLENARQEIDKISLDIGEGERRIKILEELERNLEGFSYAVKQVKKEADAGRLNGIHGPVSRLIKVAPEYATAIETALGAAGQNIVVSGENDAKAAISFLKKTSGGRATFLPLTSIKGNFFAEASMENCVGYVSRADKLVTFDSKYGEIIANLLGRIVIAEDMDSAIAMAKKYAYKFRVVTLDGQVINPGGSLTGGSNAKNAGLLNRAGQISALRQKIEKMVEARNTKAAELKALNEDYAKVNDMFVSAKSELQTANEDKIRVLGELRRLNEQLKVSQDNLAALTQSKDEASARINGLSEVISTRSEVLKTLEEERIETEGGIEILSGGKDKLRLRRTEISEQISALKLEIIGLEKDIESLNSAILQIEETKADRAGKIKSLTIWVEEFLQKETADKAKIEGLEQTLLDLSAKSNSSGEEIHALTEKRNKFEQDSYAGRNLEREKSHQKEQLSGELARLTEQKQVMERQYSEIITKLYEEYELTRAGAQEQAIAITDEKASTKRLGEIKSKIRALGSVNVAAIEEYKEVAERYEFMSAQIGDIEQSRTELNKLINSLTQSMKEMFLEQFDVISKNFTSVFKELFNGGTAQLQLTDPANVLESGIEIVAQPPGKNISIIEQLSGGEKALIAVSIYFAIMKVNPPPFCLLDEVEAALDEMNVDKVAAYLRRMSEGTQFIIITHRRGTMEEADVLYGVTMQEKGVSKLLSIDVSEIEKTLQAEVS